MDSKPNSRAVRVHGEVIVLHCWACGTAHCVNQAISNANLGNVNYGMDSLTLFVGVSFFR
jgi:hypothetical protein